MAHENFSWKTHTHSEGIESRTLSMLKKKHWSTTELQFPALTPYLFISYILRQGSTIYPGKTQVSDIPALITWIANVIGPTKKYVGYFHQSISHIKKKWVQ